MRIAPGTIVAEKYRLETQLARGGMGHVWSARHVKLGLQLAIKFLDPKLASSPSFVARFEREACAAAAIQSPHVVNVQDFGVDGGTPYIVMELLRGEDLRQRLRRVGRLSLSQTAGLLVQVGKALRRAHEAGIVHRDIKPGNLFLAKVEDDEILKVLDFGIAKEADERMGESTRTGEIVGSPHYVSPEQGRGDKDIDHRTDVWSVGVITYRMVTAHLPFPGQGLGNVLSKVLVEPPPPVRSYVPSLPESLDAFFALALAKRREDRFQSVRELVDAFVAIVRAEEAAEASIPPPSWSTIESVSKPPPPPDPGKPAAASRPERPPALAAAAPPAAPSSSSRAAPDSMSRAAPDSVSRAAAARASRAAFAFDEAEDPRPPATGKSDSLAPATWPGAAPNHAIRLRWAIVAAVGVFLAGGAILVWSQGESAPDPTQQGAASPGLPLPAAVDSPGVIVPASVTTPPLSSSASRPVAPTAATSARSAAPPASAAPRPSTAPAPAAPGSASKQKWGF